MTAVVNDVSDVGIYNIVADQGTTFMRTITYTNVNDEAINLGTGAKAHMMVRKSYPATLRAAAYREDPVIWISSDSSYFLGSTEAITLTPASGIINIAIPSGVMTNAPAGIYDYDLEVQLGIGPGIGQPNYVIKVVRGLFEVRQQMTYYSSGPYYGY